MARLRSQRLDEYLFLSLLDRFENAYALGGVIEVYDIEVSIALVALEGFILEGLRRLRLISFHQSFCSMGALCSLCLHRLVDVQVQVIFREVLILNIDLVELITYAPDIQRINCLCIYHIVLPKMDIIKQSLTQLCIIWLPLVPIRGPSVAKWNNVCDEALEFFRHLAQVFLEIDLVNLLAPIGHRLKVKATMLNVQPSFEVLAGQLLLVWRNVLKSVQPALLGEARCSEIAKILGLVFVEVRRRSGICFPLDAGAAEVGDLHVLLVLLCLTVLKRG